MSDDLGEPTAGSGDEARDSTLPGGAAAPVSPAEPALPAEAAAPVPPAEPGAPVPSEEVTAPQPSEDTGAPPLPGTDATAPGTGLPSVATPKRSRKGLFIAAIIGLVAIIGGGTFAVVQLTGSKSDGGNTPEAAVQHMLDSIANEDVLGVLSNLLPGERSAMRQPLIDLTHEAARLGILDSSVDLSKSQGGGKISGLSLSFENVKLHSIPLADGFAAVSLQRGTAKYSVIPKSLPLGSFLKSILGSKLGAPVSGSSEAGESGEEATPVVTVRENGRWYVSIWYSVAEGVRVSAGKSVPSFGHGVAAVGAASPEGAVEAMVRAATSLNIQRLIELVPPDEARVLHDYAPLFLSGAQAAADEMKKKFSIEITSLELASQAIADGSLVTVKTLTFRAQSADGTFKLAWDGSCMEGTMFGSDGALRRLCQSDLPAMGIPSIPKVKLGFVAVQRDGKWYVSPTRTLLEGVTALAKVLNSKDLEMFKSLLSGFAGANL